MELFALLLLASMNVLLGAELADLHFLALYFAQYYPIHQNRMKTEWDFFRKLPSNKSVIGKELTWPKEMYDLRDIEPRRRHAKEARAFGVDGFIYYHYWLENGPVMDSVFDSILIDNEPNLPFAFCWANEGWDDLFYGNKDLKDKLDRIAQRQRYDLPRNHAIYLAKFFKHPNYIKFNGRPVFYIYVPHDVDLSYFTAMNNELERHGIRRMFLVAFMTNIDKPFWTTPNWQSLNAEFAPHSHPKIVEGRGGRFDFFQTRIFGSSRINTTMLLLGDSLCLGTLLLDIQTFHSYQNIWL